MLKDILFISVPLSRETIGDRTFRSFFVAYFDDMLHNLVKDSLLIIMERALDC